MNPMNLDWKDIALIITIYEQEVAAKNISRYGTAKDVKPYSEKILEQYKKIKGDK